MASRDTKNLNITLTNAYYKAVDKFKQLYPTDPQPFVVCTYRSNEEQTALYNQSTDGKDNNGNGIIDEAGEKVSQAKAGQSPHNFNPSFAFDIAFINLKQKLDYNINLFKKFKDIIKEIEPQVEWGGEWKFKDYPHFQLLNWKTYIPK